MRSSCSISFFRNDLQATKLQQGKCPVKNCSVNVNNYMVNFQKWLVPFCPEHGIRIHRTSGFVYYNGTAQTDSILSTKRNLMFHGDYYIANFFKKGNKIESGRLCYENSEDAVSYNVFTELLNDGYALRKLVSYITGREINEDVYLYLWGGEVDLKNNKFIQYKPLIEVRNSLESGVRRFFTEPDIMLVVPKKIIICIEAKFGSKNPIAIERESREGEKPKKKQELIEKYCSNNKIIDKYEVFDFDKIPKLFYEQLFRNTVFAASMAKLDDMPEWHVVNLRNQHAMNLKRGKPESMPIMRNMRSILKPKYKKHFSHITWEQIYNRLVKGNEKLYNLAWYLKNKSLGCGRAFNILS